MEGVTTLAVLPNGVCSRSECGLLPSLWRCVSFVPSLVTSLSAAEAARGGEREGRRRLLDIPGELGQPVIGVGGAQEEQGWERLACGSRSTPVEAPGVPQNVERCRCACIVQFHVLSATSLARSFVLHAREHVFLSHSWSSHGPVVILDMRWLALSGLYHNVFGKRSCCSVHGHRCAWCT